MYVYDDQMNVDVYEAGVVVVLVTMIHFCDGVAAVFTLQAKRRSIESAGGVWYSGTKRRSRGRGLALFRAIDAKVCTTLVPSNPSCRRWMVRNDDNEANIPCIT